MLTWIELGPVWLSLRLAAVTTVILLIIGLPLAWWLVKGRSALCAPMNAVVTLPLVLPPSVLGFYILIALGPNGPIGQVTDALGLGTLNFTFTGLVIGSVVYSLPFMIQPVVTAFEAIGPRPMEVAATLGCRPFEAFFRVILPLARHGIITGTLMTFAHTIGEFGVVLMIGEFADRVCKGHQGARDDLCTHDRRIRRRAHDRRQHPWIDAGHLNRNLHVR